MTEFRLLRLADRLYAVDAWMDGRPGHLACYLFDTPRPALVEVGPSLTLGHLLAGLDDLGVDDLATIAVTHIHIDHAGGAGHIARRYPKARIAVHRQGARHLADPSRLWASASAAFGGEDRLAGMWGRVEPVPEDRLLVLEGGDRIPLGGGRHLEVLYTPGHARHHVVYFDRDSGGLLVGDAVGIAYGHAHLVQPVTPPPDFDPRLVTEQLHRMAELGPSFLGLAHFGPDYDARGTLRQAEEWLWAWVRFVEGLAEGDTEEAARRLRGWVLDGYRREGHPEEVIAEYDQATYWPMQVEGIRRWLSRRGG